MRKIIILAAAMLMLTATGLTPGCATPTNTAYMQQHPDEYCRMVLAAEHEKRFPHGHVHKPADDPNRRCFFSPGSPYYFCQFFDDTDE